MEYSTLDILLFGGALAVAGFIVGRLWRGSSKQLQPSVQANQEQAAVPTAAVAKTVAKAAADADRWQAKAGKLMVTLKEKQAHIQVLEQALRQAQAEMGEMQQLKVELMQSMEERRRRTLELEAQLAGFSVTGAPTAAVQSEVKATPAAGNAESPESAEAANERRRLAQTQRRLQVVEEELSRQEQSLFAMQQLLEQSQAENARLITLVRKQSKSGGSETEPAAGQDPDAPLVPDNLLSHAPAKPDDLTLVQGIGVQDQQALRKLGIYFFDQLAVLTPRHLAWLEQQLQTDGRIQAQAWIDQAAELALQPEMPPVAADPATRAARIQ